MRYPCLQATHYAYAQHYERLGEHATAVQHYERAGCASIEVP